MYQVLLILHILVAMSVIGLVLLQHGKGADIGASFGSGASNTVFGSQGTGSFLFKLTGGLVITFFVTSVLLSAIVARQYQASSAFPSSMESNVTQSHKAPLPIPE